MGQHLPTGQGKPPAVYIFHTRKVLPRNIKDTLLEIDARIVHVQDPWQWPRRSDLYVQQTALSNASRVAAATIGAQQIVMPQGAEYLARKVSQLLADGDVYIYAPSRVGENPIFRV